MIQRLTASTIPPVLHGKLGQLTRRFSHADGADKVLAADDAGHLAIVTGFGPTNAPTAGTLAVMLGIVELQRRLDAPTTVVISELGAWNSRNVPWERLEHLRDQMMAFMERIGFNPRRGTLRSHLDTANLVRAGKIARFLTRQDFHDNQESLLQLYDDHGLLGSEVGVIVDGLYTVADILGPIEHGANRILVVAGREEAYFTDLARIVLARQEAADKLSLGWQAQVGALYFRVLAGLNGYPKMSKSIPASSVHLGMSRGQLASAILSDEEASQPALLQAIQLSSGWDEHRLDDARAAHANRAAAPAAWRRVRGAYLETFQALADQWKSCVP